MTGARIPLTVVGGFLGAGKTTLMNRVLAGMERIRAAVLVNDFGTVNIDAELVASRDGETIALTNGCICCSIGDDLTDALIRVMRRTPPPGWILIEASGVSDPWRIAQVGLTDPGLSLDGLVVLADAESVREQAADRYLSDTILRQFAAADLVVLNKTDLVSETALAETRAWLTKQVPGGRVFEARNAEVPLELLTGVARRHDLRGEPTHACSDGCEAGGVHEHVDHAEQFSSWTFTHDGVFSGAKLRALLKAMPAGVIRAKGLVRTDEAPVMELQFTGRRGNLRPAGPQRIERPGIVFIGARGRLPVVEIQALLQEAILALPASLSPRPDPSRGPPHA